MKLNVLFISFLSFIAGMATIYMLSPNSITKNEKPKNQPIKTVAKIQKEFIKSLPDFVKKDIQNAKIDTDDFNKQKWKKFLQTIKSNDSYINNLEDKYKTKNGKTLLHVLLSSSLTDAALIEKLVKDGFDIDAKDNHGLTPLLTSAKYSNFKTLSKLIELGADISDTDEAGHDILFYALTNPNPMEKRHIVDYLISKQGFDIASEKYLLPTSLKGNNEYLLKILPTIKQEDLPSSFNTVLKGYGANDEVLKYFMDKNIKLSNNEQFFTNVAINDDISNDLIQKIIDKENVDFALVDQSALSMAVLKGNLKRVQLYLENGANPNGVDKFGNSAYDYMKSNTIEIMDMPLSYTTTKTKKKQMLELLNKYNNKQD